MRPSRVVTCVLPGLVGLALLAGCASAPVEVPPQAIGQLLDMRNGLLDGKAQIQKTTGMAKDLVDRPRQDVPAQVAAFRSQMEQLSKDALQARERAAATQAQAQDHFARWEQQLKTMSGDLAQGGEKRRAEAMASFKELSDRLGAVKTQFGPFMSDLQEADRYLASDATAAGVKVAAPTIRKALGREQDVLKSIDALIGQIDAVRGGK